MNLHWEEEIVSPPLLTVVDAVSIFYSEFKLHLQIVHKDTLSKIEAKPKKHGPPRVLFNLPLFKLGK